MGLPCSAPVTTNGLGPLYPPVASGAHEQRPSNTAPRHCAILAQANSVLGLVQITMFIERSRVLTIPFNPSPSLPDAGRTIAFSRRRSRPCGRRLHCRRALYGSLPYRTTA